MKNVWMMLAVLVFAGCATPEEKAKDAIADYEKTAFPTCKDITAETNSEPGTHYCSKVTSMALEMALQDSGLPEADWKKMVDEWSKSSELGKFYVDEAARENIKN